MESHTPEILRNVIEAITDFWRTVITSSNGDEVAAGANILAVVVPDQDDIELVAIPSIPGRSLHQILHACGHYCAAEIGDPSHVFMCIHAESIEINLSKDERNQREQILIFGGDEQTDDLSFVELPIVRTPAGEAMLGEAQHIDADRNHIIMIGSGIEAVWSGIACEKRKGRRR